MFRMITTPKALVASALLAAFAAGVAPAASAGQTLHTFQVVFAYNTADAPQKIYAELNDTAYKACRQQKFSSYHLARMVHACKNEVIAAALAAMKRADVAMLHTKIA